MVVKPQVPKNETLVPKSKILIQQNGLIPMKWPLSSGLQDGNVIYSGEVQTKDILDAGTRQPFDPSIGVSPEQVGVNRRTVEARAKRMAKTFDKNLSLNKPIELGIAILVAGPKDIMEHDGSIYYAPKTLLYVDWQHRGRALQIANEEPLVYPNLHKYANDSTTTVKIIVSKCQESKLAVAQSKFLAFNSNGTPVASALKLAMKSLRDDDELSEEQLIDKIVYKTWELQNCCEGGCWYKKIDTTGDINIEIRHSKNKLVSMKELCVASGWVLRNLLEIESHDSAEDKMTALDNIITMFFDPIRAASPAMFSEFSEYTIQRKHSPAMCRVLAALLKLIKHTNERKPEDQRLTVSDFMSTQWPDMLKKAGNLVTSEDFWSVDGGNANQNAGFSRTWEKSLANQVWRSLKPPHTRVWVEFLPYDSVPSTAGKR